MNAYFPLLLSLLMATSLHAGRKTGFKIEIIEGRHWLVKPNGQPFFAHGITHASNRDAALNYQKFSEACKAVGFNAYGYGCPEPLRKDMPFVESWNHLVPISYYRGKNGVRFVDVFDPKVQKKLETGIKAKCLSSRDNPNTIGYCWTDLGSWPLENPSGKNWVNFIRELPEGAPGQKAYQRFLETWEGSPGKPRDLGFLRLIAKQYFKVVGEAQRAYAPGHLVFGERFADNASQYYNTIVEEVLEEMLPYVDALAIQPAFEAEFPKDRFDQIHSVSGKPILICDFAIRFKDGDKDISSWKFETDSIAAGKAYDQYLRDALATGYVIGSFWCNPVDTSKGFDKPGVKQGFFGDGLSPRPGLHKSVLDLNRHISQTTPNR
ncbi:MAG: beta-agarase [Verrucomicrobiota bacterium]|nr:beta-agarase [Verrucomicrobiota bacterium]